MYILCYEMFSITTMFYLCVNKSIVSSKNEAFELNFMEVEPRQMKEFSNDFCYQWSMLNVWTILSFQLSKSSNRIHCGLLFGMDVKQKRHNRTETHLRISCTKFGHFYVIYQRKWFHFMYRISEAHIVTHYRPQWPINNVNIFLIRYNYFFIFIDCQLQFFDANLLRMHSNWYWS